MRRVRTLPRAAGIAVAAALAALATPAAVAGESTFSVDPPAVESFLKAVTPYELEVGKGGLVEKLVLSNPREVRFEKGAVRLKLDVRGDPFPIEMVLQPAITVAWDEKAHAWMARISSFPIEVPVFGTFDLAKYLAPYPIAQTFSQPAGNDNVTFSIDGRLSSLKILDDRILVVADLTFRAVPPPQIQEIQPPPAVSNKQ